MTNNGRPGKKVSRSRGEGAAAQRQARPAWAGSGWEREDRRGWDPDNNRGRPGCCRSFLWPLLQMTTNMLA